MNLDGTFDADVVHTDGEESELEDISGFRQVGAPICDATPELLRQWETALTMICSYQCDN